MADQTKAFAVTGTLGIGKTIFLWYPLRLLRKQSAVVVFKDCVGEFLLVHPNGVILSGVRGVSFLRCLSDPDTIYLCGARPQHEPLFSVCISATAIVTASPDPPLLQQFVEEVRPKLLCMAMWSLEELEACRDLCCKLTTSKETVAALYACFGGTAQDTLIPDQALAMALEKFHTEMKALSDADIQINMNIMGRSYFEEIKICHRLVHLQPMKDDTGADQFDEVLLLPASEAACCEIVRRMTVASARTVQKALPPTDRVSQLVVSHEALVEGWANNTLIAGGVFNIRKLGVGNECDRVVEHKTIAAQSVVFDTIVSVQGDQYGIPISQNFLAVDAIAGPNELFQMTISASHPIRHEDLEKVLHQMITEAQPDSLQRRERTSPRTKT
jgi:hypothetical protein